VFAVWLAVTAHGSRALLLGFAAFSASEEEEEEPLLEEPPLEELWPAGQNFGPMIILGWGILSPSDRLSQQEPVYMSQAQ
jgi:hypothetical protein